MTDATMTAQAIKTAEAETPTMLFWRKFRRHKGGVVGLAIFIAILLIVFVGPFIHTIDPNKIDIRAKNQGPSLAHPSARTIWAMTCWHRSWPEGRFRSPSA